MNAITWATVGALGLAGLLWGRIAWGAWRLRALPALGHPPYPGPRPWPRLAVLIAARNEADTIEPAFASLLAQDYPELEIVLVDDRSTDRTGEVIERLARGDGRATVVRIRELPAGWLGKVHALQRGLEASHAELVLLTDADVCFAPGALREAVAFMTARGLDHLAAIPRFEKTVGLVDIETAGGLRGLLTLVLPPWRATDADPRHFFGVGAFNLVRRAAFARTEGFAYLRMETADDVGVGMVLKRSGASSAAASAFDLVSVAWHRSLGSLFRGAEKAYATLGDCSAARMLLLAAAMAWIDAAPLVGVAFAACGHQPTVRLAGGAVGLAFVLANLLFARFTRGFLVCGLLTPLLVPITVATILRAAWLGWRRGGVDWRESRYRSAELRAGRRVRVPF